MAVIAEREAVIQLEEAKHSTTLQSTKWKHEHEVQNIIEQHQIDLQYYEDIKSCIQRDMDYQFTLLKFHHDQRTELEEYFLQQFWKHLEERNKSLIKLYETYAHHLGNASNLNPPRGANLQKLQEQHQRSLESMNKTFEQNVEKLKITSAQQLDTINSRIEGLRAQYATEEENLRSKLIEEFKQIDLKGLEEIERQKEELKQEKNKMTLSKPLPTPPNVTVAEHAGPTSTEQ